MNSQCTDCCKTVNVSQNETANGLYISEVACEFSHEAMLSGCTHILSNVI